MKNKSRSRQTLDTACESLPIRFQRKPVRIRISVCFESCFRFCNLHGPLRRLKHEFPVDVSAGQNLLWVLKAMSKGENDANFRRKAGLFRQIFGIAVITELSSVAEGLPFRSRESLSGD